MNIISSAWICTHNLLIMSFTSNTLPLDWGIHKVDVINNVLIDPRCLPVFALDVHERLSLSGQICIFLTKRLRDLYAWRYCPYFNSSICYHWHVQLL